MGILPLKKRVNRDKCSFATKQRIVGVFAIDEILRYRGTRFPGSRTLCHPASQYISRNLAWTGVLAVVSSHELNMEMIKENLRSILTLCDRGIASNSVIPFTLQDLQ